MDRWVLLDHQDARSLWHGIERKCTYLMYLLLTNLFHRHDVSWSPTDKETRLAYVFFTESDSSPHFSIIQSPIIGSSCHLMYDRVSFERAVPGCMDLILVTDYVSDQMVSKYVRRFSVSLIICAKEGIMAPSQSREHWSSRKHKLNTGMHGLK